MTSYSFESVINQTLTFSATGDTLTVSGGARNLLIETVGTNLRLTTAAGSVTLANTSLANLSPSNLLFLDGSVVAVGDLTAATGSDTLGNTIDFATNGLLAGAINRENLIYGLEGADAIAFGAGIGNTIVYGGAGADTIVAGSGDNTIFGGSQIADSADGADRITISGTSNNIVYANGGDDSLAFSSAVTSIHTLFFYGGAGNDTMASSGASGVIVADGGDGNDQLSITFGSGNNTVYGGLGNDTLDFSFSSGSHTIFGGRSSADTTDGGDSIIAGIGNATIYANAGNDTVIANAQAGSADLIYLGAGNDSLTSGVTAGIYEIYGNLGSDTINLTGHTGTAVVYGGGGSSDPNDSSDTIIGGAQNSLTVYGNAGSDTITLTPVSGASAVVYGGIGNDTINATPLGAGSFLQLQGNEGNDRFALNFAAASTTINILDFSANGNTDTLAVTLPGGVSATDLTLVRGASDSVIQFGTLSVGLANFTGSLTAANFVLNGSVLLANTLATSATLTGGAGNDQLIAGSGGDMLTAGAGNDLLTGGAGDDKFSFTAADFTMQDRISAGAGVDRLELTTAGVATTDDKFGQVTGLETIKLGNVDFSALASQITLGTLASAAGVRQVDASAITGSGGARVDASALSNNFTFTGGAGADIVTGTLLIDGISGGAGNDVLAGNLSGDALDGGAGNDVYVYGAATANISLEGGDAVLSFDPGTSTTAADSFRFTAGALNYNLGNLDTVVSGAIISSIVPAGGASTELVILNSVGIATGAITASLDVINGSIAAGKGVLDVFFDSTQGSALLYYDQNGGAVGGHILLATILGVTSLADMTKFDFGDFSFV